jgi:hypothetical protein
VEDERRGEQEERFDEADHRQRQIQRDERRQHGDEARTVPQVGPRIGHGAARHELPVEQALGRGEEIGLVPHGLRAGLGERADRHEEGEQRRQAQRVANGAAAGALGPGSGHAGACTQRGQRSARTERKQDLPPAHGSPRTRR